MKLQIRWWRGRNCENLSNLQRIGIAFHLIFKVGLDHYVNMQTGVHLGLVSMEQYVQAEMTLITVIAHMDGVELIVRLTCIIIARQIHVRMEVCFFTSLLAFINMIIIH